MAQNLTAIFPIRNGPGAEDASMELSMKLNEWLGHSGPTGLFRTCGTCIHMERPPYAACCKKFNMVPPVDIILKGCDGYGDEAEVPF